MCKSYLEQNRTAISYTVYRVLHRITSQVVLTKNITMERSHLFFIDFPIMVMNGNIKYSWVSQVIDHD